MVNKSKYLGCFLGLAIGDAYGAPFEGGTIERLLWKAIGKTKDGKKRYTDDTQMSIDIAQSFITQQRINQNHLAITFANSYRWSRGYGTSAAWLLKKIKNGADWKTVTRAKFKDGSYGNGAAMRAAVVALCYPKDLEELNKNITRCSEITHAHHLGIEGAKLIAFVTFSALHNQSNETIIDALPAWCLSEIFKEKVLYCIEALQSTKHTEIKLIKKNLGAGIAAAESCVTAIYFALKYRERSHDKMLTEIYSQGGDTDTIGAMAGAIWGAFNGVESLNKNRIQNLESADKIKALACSLYELSQ